MRTINPTAASMRGLCHLSTTTGKQGMRVQRPFLALLLLALLSLLVLHVTWLSLQASQNSQPPPKPMALLSVVSSNALPSLYLTALCFTLSAQLEVKCFPRGVEHFSTALSW